MGWLKPKTPTSCPVGRPTTSTMTSKDRQHAQHGEDQRGSRRHVGQLVAQCFTHRLVHCQLGCDLVERAPSDAIEDARYQRSPAQRHKEDVNGRTTTGCAPPPSRPGTPTGCKIAGKVRSPRRHARTTEQRLGMIEPAWRVWPGDGGTFGSHGRNHPEFGRSVQPVGGLRRCRGPQRRGWCRSPVASPASDY
jgi:hypothetical protein